MHCRLCIAQQYPEKWIHERKARMTRRGEEKTHRRYHWKRCLKRQTQHLQFAAAGTSPVCKQQRQAPTCAKYAEAFLNISLARRNSRISRSIVLIWARSSEVWPSLRPLSISDCLTHLRSVSLPHPIFGAMAMIAADWLAYSCSCSKIIRTARVRTSVENRFALLLFSMSTIQTCFGASAKLWAVQFGVPSESPFCNLK